MSCGVNIGNDSSTIKSVCPRCHGRPFAEFHGPAFPCEECKKLRAELAALKESTSRLLLSRLEVGKDVNGDPIIRLIQEQGPAAELAAGREA